MSEILKVNACVYSRKGNKSEVNCDDFYMNGKFLSEHHLDNMEAALENRGVEFFFAVADHMEYSDEEQRASFSILREIGKFHEKITVHEGDSGFKTKELSSRVTETAKYLESFMDMNKIPEEDPARSMGFSGLLLTEGKAFGATFGTGHIYFCRGNSFKHISAERAQPKRLVELGIISDDEVDDFQEKYSISEEDSQIVPITEPIDVQEGDKFLLISDGVYNALGEENLEDILSMRSDSTYIAYRVISEAMKRNSEDDMTAMVVRIERVTSPNAAVVRKAAEKPKASALKSTPPPKYKYNKNANRKNFRKYENIIYYTAVVLTAVLLVVIMYFVISNLLNKLKDTEQISPTPSISVSVSPAPTEPLEITPEPTPEPTPTQAPVAEVKTHKVASGETLSSIARKYYGDNWVYVERLGMYNQIPAPYDTIVVDQILKIPPKEELMANE
ncbi:MAG: LysM peptidoglycan-binding domain-containing protein [Clostridiaceae bacterium]|nr:LysM peptidoglycan-binding domain-containing protein [Clostridiaceae bacterium]